MTSRQVPHHRLASALGGISDVAELRSVDMLLGQEQFAAEDVRVPSVVAEPGDEPLEVVDA